ncbi:AAA family ATPase [Nocardia salmonicida]
MVQVNASANISLPPPFSSSALSSLRELATLARSGVTIICGFPAAGKTTATRFLAGLVDAVVLDKDTFAPQLEESVMSELNGNPFDRDSDIYRRVVSPNIYAALLNHAVRIGARCPDPRRRPVRRSRPGRRRQRRAAHRPHPRSHRGH